MAVLVEQSHVNFLEVNAGEATMIPCILVKYYEFGFRSIVCEINLILANSLLAKLLKVPHDSALKNRKCTLLPSKKGSILGVTHFAV